MAVLMFLVSLATTACITSCGTTHAVVRTKDSGQATITITTNNPVDVSTTPNIDVKLSKDK